MPEQGDERHRERHGDGERAKRRGPALPYLREIELEPLDEEDRDERELGQAPDVVAAALEAHPSEATGAGERAGSEHEHGGRERAPSSEP